MRKFRRTSKRNGEKMTGRIAWDRYEVALLFDTYERVAGGSDINLEAVRLSGALRSLATHKGVLIDETYRNINGMKMQLANVQYFSLSVKKDCPAHRLQFAGCMNCTKQTMQNAR